MMTSSCFAPHSLLPQPSSLTFYFSSIIIVEEKGKDPVVYYIEDVLESDIKGSKEDPVNLVADVYGYQTTWTVVREDQWEKYNEACLKYTLDTPENSDEILKEISSYWLFATHRTITTPYTATYETEMFWVCDEKNSGKLGRGVNRIIYHKR